MIERDLSSLRSELLELVTPEDRRSVGQLIDALAAWSEAAGLSHDPPTGSDPVIRFRAERNGVEVWAIYPSKAKGGAKLSLVPGLTDHPSELREVASSLTSSSGTTSYDGRKLDLSLPELAARSSWVPVFKAAQAALDHANSRGGDLSG